ncbi:hypothetical protein CJF42_20435 [Pseudoalteromonas sp. NBT06-2]|uniref:class I SAM-dependent methyltransferase n=1 Tax=Pseudoalteromonas sp. NBT06-2 TaxID=2025950 RepID=UPI000BA6A2BB|nr:class I SAM-dependent methyltransferase [Pseudoalteromonas sp. NBT06-2]PAJ72591.1 hypothetical protein CJF42_20435 [Pseudoalteromonas sp. NBT06-2]
MFINPNWRILTIGDGDLSFSASLLNHHTPKKLTATVLDSLETLTKKYDNKAYQILRQHHCEVLTLFDVTNKKTWSNLKQNSYDLVVFQFPLIPAFSSQDDFHQHCSQANISVNTLNRHLLRTFLINTFSHFLDPKGENLCFITSKDVKPYRDWDIENTLLLGIKNDKNLISYLGQMNFDINHFPGYKIRNVDRDKHVKNTQGNTYVYSNQTHAELSKKLMIPDYAKASLSDTYCAFCRVGPFYSHQDKLEHQSSKRHKKMTIFHNQWLNYLNLS